MDFTPKNVGNVFIVYEVDAWSRGLNTAFPLKDCLCGAVKLVKNADPDKYSYSGFGNGFDSSSLFSVLNSCGKNVTIFGVEIS